MAIAGLCILGVTAAAPSDASAKAEIDASASKVLVNFYALNSRNNPLTDKAIGVLIFRKITKGGAGVAGAFGEGVLRVNGEAVNHYSDTSASVGVTLGVASHSEVILFMSQEALDTFKRSDGWSAGADSSFALVSKGATGQCDTVTLNKPILGFV